MSSDNVMELDLNDYDPAKAEGGDYPVPGKAHVRVAELTLFGGRNGQSHKISMEILAHSAGSDEVGKMQTEYPSVKSSAGYRMRELAVACGLITRERLNECKANRENPTIDWGAAVGCQFFTLLSAEEYEGETRTRVGAKGAGWYPLDHPRCSQYPRHERLYMEARESAINGGLPKSKDDLATSSQPATSGAASGPADDDF